MLLDSSTTGVRCELRGNILLIILDTLVFEPDVRRRILAEINAADSDQAVDAVLLVGTGGHGINDAQIREFGQLTRQPSLSKLCDRIEQCRKRVVAVIHGETLGAELAIALAAHYRLAMVGAKMGLPEVQLGLLPYGGATQRVPRLIGAKAALDMMLSGRSLGVEEAYTLGVVDRWVDSLKNDDDLLEQGLAYIQELSATQAPVRCTRDASALTERRANRAEIEAVRVELNKKSQGLFSPLKIVEAVEAAVDYPFDKGLSHEHTLFLQCLDSPQHVGLTHALFAEREVLKAPEIRDAKSRSIVSLGVVGGGTMGAGIAVAGLDAGLLVTMIERDETALARGRERIEAVYDGLIAKGRISVADKRATMTRFTSSIDYRALAQSDLVVEAVFEDIAIKQAVFVELDRVCKAGSIFATNTSYLDINAIAASVSRPADVIGLHFFSPANIMKLLEIVVPARVSADVVVTAFELAKIMRKVPVRAGVCDGFIGNRILGVYRQAADHMMEEGASPYQIDQTIREFGYPMGPFQVVDLAGGDIGWATRKRKAATRNPQARYVHISDRICERGWFGQKTGRGYYLYPKGMRTGVPDPDVHAIIDAERVRVGITPRNFTNEEIIERYMAAMINEGANVVHQGIALRPLDIDVTFLYGYGFPRYRGGPMKYADMIGLPTVLASIQAFAKEDPLFWQPSPLLVELVERGENFDTLNQIK